MSSPGVRFPPPIIFVTGLVIAWWLDRRVKSLPLSAFGGAALEVAGLVLVIAGFALGAWGLLTFARARTAILPHHAASRLVRTGPYRFTRNPMYTGLTMGFIGAAGLLDSAWPLILLPVVLAVLIRFVVSKEEAYLREAFGEDYVSYQAEVRRWL